MNIPLQINTTVSHYNVDDLENMARLMEEFEVALWSVFFLVPTGRGQVDDMITPEEHENVFQWLSVLSSKVSFDIKTTAAQHYRRVLIQHKKRSKGDQPSVFQDALNYGKIRIDDGLGRAPKGVNDGNGFVFISHIGDVYPSGFLPIKCGNVREQSLADIYRYSPVMQQLRNPALYKGKCGVCEFNKICGGSRARAYAVTGDYLESEPFCTYQPKQWRKQ